MKCYWCQNRIVRNLTLKEILFPFSSQETLCLDCQKLFVKTPTVTCPNCCKIGYSEKCLECLAWQIKYPDLNIKHHSFFIYDETFREWIYQYKFQGDYRLRQTFKLELKQYFNQHKDALVCPIPLSTQRYQARGFNQTQAMLEAAGVSCTMLLTKKIDTQAQAQKSKRERLLAPQPFEVTKAGLEIEGKKIIIFDDVYTTGQTLLHAMSRLNTYKPREITTVSLAR